MAGDMPNPSLGLPPGLPLGLPPSARLLGWELLALDAEAGTIRIRFKAGEDFLNPAGFVQGGILIAMMDDAMGPCVLAHSKGRFVTSSIDIHAHFLRPTPPGVVEVEAAITRLGRQVGFLEARLFDAEGRLCARATSSAALVPLAGGGAPGTATP